MMWREYINGFSTDGDEPPSKTFYRASRIDHPGWGGIPEPIQRKPAIPKAASWYHRLPSSLVSANRMYNILLFPKNFGWFTRKWHRKRLSKMDLMEIDSLTDEQRYAIAHVLLRSVRPRVGQLTDEENYFLTDDYKRRYPLSCF